MTIAEIKTDQAVNIEVIELLEELLDNARAGELHELIVMGRYGNDFTTYYTKTDNVPELIGRLEMMKNNQILRAKT